jgi:hypothetical protein
MEEPTRSIEKTVESMFFVELNEDSFMPINVLAMVELSDCKLLCGGVTVDEIKLGDDYEFGTETEDREQEAKNEESTNLNKDSCLAVAGLAMNNTVAVRKYCVPKAQGQGVRSEPSQNWFVWYSEEWSATLVSLHFADTVTGDTLIALRDNHGRTLDSGHVLEDIVSVHSRFVLYPFCFWFA